MRLTYCQTPTARTRDAQGCAAELLRHGASCLCRCCVGGALSDLVRLPPCRVRRPFHLPLHPTNVDFGKANRLTIAVNNTLTSTTIPPGFVQTNLAGRRVQRLQMDFFHYAGIHRQVLLYTTPAAYLDDVLVSCRLEGSTAHLNVFVSTLGPGTAVRASIDCLIV